MVGGQFSGQIGPELWPCVRRTGRRCLPIWPRWWPRWPSRSPMHGDAGTPAGHRTACMQGHPVCRFCKGPCLTIALSACTALCDTARAARRPLRTAGQSTPCWYLRSVASAVAGSSWTVRLATSWRSRWILVCRWSKATTCLGGVALRSIWAKAVCMTHGDRHEAPIRISDSHAALIGPETKVQVGPLAATAAAVAFHAVRKGPDCRLPSQMALATTRTEARTSGAMAGSTSA